MRVARGPGGVVGAQVLPLGVDSRHVYVRQGSVDEGRQHIGLLLPSNLGPGAAAPFLVGGGWEMIWSAIRGERPSGRGDRPA